METNALRVKHWHILLCGSVAAQTLFLWLGYLVCSSLPCLNECNALSVFPTSNTYHHLLCSSCSVSLLIWLTNCTILFLHPLIILLLPRACALGLAAYGWKVLLERWVFHLVFFLSAVLCHLSKVYLSERSNYLLHLPPSVNCYFTPPMTSCKLSIRSSEWCITDFSIFVLKWKESNRRGINMKMSFLPLKWADAVMSSDF